MQHDMTSYTVMTTGNYVLTSQTTNHSVNFSHWFSAVSFNESSVELRCKWGTFNSVLEVLLLLTMVLNVLAAFVLFRVPLTNARGRSNPVYLCIRFLNITDILQAILLMVMPIFARPDCSWFGGILACRIMGFLALFLLLISPLITIFMAFDRVIALYHPFKYRSNLGMKILKIMLPTACGLVFITTVLPIFGIGEYHVVRGRRLCLLDTITDDPVDRSYVLMVHAIILFALCFMTACTVAFQVRLGLMSFRKKRKQQQSKPPKRKKTSGRRTRNATITTMCICSIFIICYLPYVIRVIVETSSGEKSATWATWITFGMAFMQPLMNPIVCISTNVRYRKELLLILQRIQRSEIDLSSESATATSRGTIKTDFRRRFSSSGTRKSSAHSSLRGRERQTSTTNPTAAPQQPRNLRLAKLSRSSWYADKEMRKGSSSSDVFEEGIPFKSKYATTTLYDTRLKANDMHLSHFSNGGTEDNQHSRVLHSNSQRCLTSSHELNKNSKAEADNVGEVVNKLPARLQEEPHSQLISISPLVAGEQQKHDQDKTVGNDATRSKRLGRSKRERLTTISDHDEILTESDAPMTIVDVVIKRNITTASNDLNEKNIQGSYKLCNAPSKVADLVKKNSKIWRHYSLRKPSHRDSGMIDVNSGSENST